MRFFWKITGTHQKSIYRIIKIIHQIFLSIFEKYENCERFEKIKIILQF